MGRAADRRVRDRARAQAVEQRRRAQPRRGAGRVRRVSQARFRTALARACRAAGVPAFSPHDLRHRRVSRLHADGVSWARIGELVGHSDLVTTARTYTHVVADEAELDYARPLPDGDNCEQERIKGFGWDSLDPRSASGYGLAGTRHDGSVATRLESGRNGPDFPRHPVV